MHPSTRAEAWIVSSLSLLAMTQEMSGSCFSKQREDVIPHSRGMMCPRFA
jgi:hypothetical protein